jgi:hypothetical protein
MIWFICQFGVFEVANRVEGWWLNYTSPNITPYIGQAIKMLILNMITTWTRSWNVYDNNQWTLLPLLKGAFLVYIMLFATAYMKPRYRMMVEMGLFVYYYISNDCASPNPIRSLSPANQNSRLRHAILLRNLPF